MNPARTALRYCACCPAPCRSAMSAEAAAQPESTTPTGLAMIALAVIDGELPFDDSTRAALARLSGARSCVAACPHGYDIASLIADYTKQWAVADRVTATP